MQAIYYNTTSQNGPELKKMILKAGSQTEAILKFFQNHKESEFTPIAVNQYFPLMLITSVRRSITTLTELGMIERTENKVMERHGAENYTWKLK